MTQLKEDGYIFKEMSHLPRFWKSAAQAVVALTATAAFAKKAVDYYRERQNRSSFIGAPVIAVVGSCEHLKREITGILKELGAVEVNMKLPYVNDSGPFGLEPRQIDSLATVGSCAPGLTNPIPEPVKASVNWGSDPLNVGTLLSSSWCRMLYDGVKLHAGGYPVDFEQFIISGFKSNSHLSKVPVVVTNACTRDEKKAVESYNGIIIHADYEPDRSSSVPPGIVPNKEIEAPRSISFYQENVGESVRDTLISELVRCDIVRL